MPRDRKRPLPECLESIGELRAAADRAGAYLVGVVGFSGGWRKNSRDDAKAVARRVLQDLFGTLGDRGASLWCVSGATDSGVPALAYQVARQRALPCVGVTAEQALSLRLAELDRLSIVGRRFGDESVAFVDTCDAFWMIGGGPQSEREMRLAAARGKPIVVVRGLGGHAERLTLDDLPTARFVSCDDPGLGFD